MGTNSIVPQHSVRITTNSAGEERFVACDVCSLIGLSNSTQVSSQLDSDEVDTSFINTRGGLQPFVTLTEPGLYALVFGSRKPKAKILADFILSHVKTHTPWTFDELFSQIEPDLDFLERVRLKRRLLNTKRRAQKLARHESYSVDDILTMYKRQHGRCYYCQKKLDGTYTIDHIAPLSRGGADALDNLVIACKPCNSSKNARFPHEWPEGGRLL